MKGNRKSTELEKFKSAKARSFYVYFPFLSSKTTLKRENQRYKVYKSTYRCAKMAISFF